MATIAENVKQHENLIAAGKGTPVSAEVPTTPPSPMPMPVGTAGILGPVRGSFQPTQILATDFQKANSIGGQMRSPVFPISSPSTIEENKTTNVTNVTEGSSASSLTIEVNGNETPNQEVLNLVEGSGIQLSVNNNGAVNIVSTNAGDGLIHGDSIWEIDPAYFILRDDFIQGGTSSGTIGQLGWLMPNTGSAVSQFTGTPPNFGTIGIPSSGSNNTYNRAYLGSSSGDTPYATSWDLLNNPGWKCIWVWKFDAYAANGASGPAFSMAKKSFYIGLAMPYISEVTPRPHVFCGLRFDTDTTSPSISDTAMQFEVVENPITSSRNNTQGTVVSTGVTPTAGAWYRLEIECVAAGVITMSLNGSTPQSFTVPTISIVGTSSTNMAAGSGGAYITIANASWTVVPWSVGTQLTVSGLTGGNASLNGTHVVSYNVSSGLTFGFPSSATIGSNDEACTTAGYPSLIPFFTWGTDTESSPTADSGEFYLDFFSFVWNPGVGGGSGTPVSTDSRYWT